MIINIINLKKREDRRELVSIQMDSEKAAYRFWEGFEGANAKTNISRSHKLIIGVAKQEGWPCVAVAEDDLVWAALGSWKYFLDNIPKDSDMDMFVSSYYSGSHDENYVVSGLRGLTLYIAFQRYYDKFLSLPETIHIDSAIAMSGAKIVVCDKFVALQRPGYSDQRKRWADDSRKVLGKEIFGQ